MKTYYSLQETDKVNGGGMTTCNCQILMEARVEYIDLDCSIWHVILVQIQLALNQLAPGYLSFGN